MWGLEPEEEEKKSITSTLCPCPAVTTWVEGEEYSSTHSLFRALLADLPHQSPPSISAPFLACSGCLCVQKESESSTRPIIHSEFGFLLPGVPLWSSWLQVLAPVASQAACVGAACRNK